MTRYITRFCDPEAVKSQKYGHVHKNENYILIEEPYESTEGSQVSDPQGIWVARAIDLRDAKDEDGYQPTHLVWNYLEEHENPYDEEKSFYSEGSVGDEFGRANLLTGEVLDPDWSEY